MAVQVLDHEPMASCNETEWKSDGFDDTLDQSFPYYREVVAKARKKGRRFRTIPIGQHAQ